VKTLAERPFMAALPHRLTAAYLYYQNIIFFIQSDDNVYVIIQPDDTVIFMLSPCKMITPNVDGNVNIQPNDNAM
jgi:hypothetical protein